MTTIPATKIYYSAGATPNTSRTGSFGAVLTPTPLGLTPIVTATGADGLSTQKIILQLASAAVLSARKTAWRHIQL